MAGLGCKVTPRTIFTVKSFVNLLIDYCHKVKIANLRYVKTCSLTKLWVLNPNLRPEVSYDEIVKNFQNEAVN